MNLTENAIQILGNHATIVGPLKNENQNAKKTSTLLIIKMQLRLFLLFLNNQLKIC